jgi:type I protein arginine methyltransferase
MAESALLEMLRFHRFLLAQNGRLDKLREAISSRVQAGNVVLDLGTGTGILAFFACLAGARRVYAVERGPVIEVARLLARENGFGDRVVFLDGISQDLDLPESVDVILSDTFSLWQPEGLRALVDARDRWLKPGGVLIPSSIELFVAPVEVPEIYRRHIDFWNRSRYGVDLSSVRQLAANHCYPVRVKPSALLAEPASFVRFELTDLMTVSFRGEACPTTPRHGTLHGVCVWLINTLVDQLTLGNHPSMSVTKTTNYAQGFFPVARPIAVEEGDRTRISLASYDSVEWRWRVEVDRKGRSASEDGMRFDHSTFWGFPLSSAGLQKLAPDRTPKLSPRGEAERFLLGLSDGRTSIGELEERLLERYPSLFKSRQDAGAFVAEVVSRCA